jgi:hypothetical protein
LTSFSSAGNSLSRFLRPRFKQSPDGTQTTRLTLNITGAIARNVKATLSLERSVTGQDDRVAMTATNKLVLTRCFSKIFGAASATEVKIAYMRVDLSRTLIPANRHRGTRFLGTEANPALRPRSIPINPLVF